MTAEAEHHDADSPEPQDSSQADQPGSPPSTDESGTFQTSTSNSPGTPPQAAAASHGQSEPAKSGPKEPAKQPAPPAPKQSTASVLSSAILMIVGAAIAGGTFFLAREFAPPKPPGEVAEKPPADMVKTEDFKKLSDRVDQINSNLSTTEKQVADQPNYGPDLKTIRDRMTELDRTVAAMPAQFDSLNQKVATMSKVEDSTSASQIDGLNKRIAELSQTVSSLKNSPSSTQAATNINTDTKGNDLALGEAIQLFKNRKWAEARDAFIRMQTSAPNDARVWYLSALANGFATNQWEGETRRLVSMGLEKEKMGQTSPATINATLDFLTTPTGKDWLADYRKSISPN